jgi:flagellar L-ring protein precursor FlgH
MNSTIRTVLAGVLAFAGGASAQSLFLLEPPAPPPAEKGRGEAWDPAEPLYPYSMFAVQPPKPRDFLVHDLVTIIVDETSRQQAEQSLKTDKKYNIDASLSQFPSLAALAQFALENGDPTNPINLGLDAKNKFDGKGKYERSDRFSAKITAEIIDIKPNGTIVLEARKRIEKDEETTTLVLSGRCRIEDVTTSNTVLSSQLADLTLVSTNEGQVKDTGTKGLIPRILETLFAF